MKQSEHGNTGNSNAKKENPARGWLQVRVTDEEKERIKQDAKEAGQTMSNYVRTKLNLFD
jgi:predicted HicB family RNase H-like nuclease